MIEKRGIKRKVKFEYYEVVYKEKDDPPEMPDRLFDLQMWLDKAEKLSLEGRTFDYYLERARLERFEYDELGDCWFLNFTRLRETNIPSKCKLNGEIEPIELDDDEFIGEDVSMLYDPKLHVAMLQKNIYSLGRTGIEKYLNLLWGSDNEEIFLRPIITLDFFERALNAEEYRKILVRFASLDDKYLKNKYKGSNTSIKRMVEMFGKYNALTAEIVISVGYAKKASLCRETVHEVLKEIQENKELFKKAQVVIKKSEDEPIEIIDLFEDKLHDYLEFYLEARQSLACRYVWDGMLTKYKERRPEILNLLRRPK